VAIKRLQDHGPHPRREPHHGLVIRDWAVPGDIGQRLGIGDRPALKQQVTSLLLGEDRRTMVAIRLGVDSDED
jgi:hypothetical protein